MNILERKANIFNRPLTRRQLISFLSISLGPPLLISSYGFGFETRNLKVESVKLPIIGFPGKFRVAQLSDFHFSSKSRFMDNVVKTVNDLKPDHVYITGDLVDKRGYLNDCLDWISNLDCKNIYFSPGNWEHWSGTLKNGLTEKLNEIGVSTLNNSGRNVETQNGTFFLAGIDDAYYGSPDVINAFKNNKHNLPAIVLSHSPLGINVVRPMKPALVLSGHTHGGQIRIPGMGAIETPPGSGRYEQGLYSVDKIKLYVNRGIGTSIIPARLFCPPEVTLIDIVGT